MKILVTGASGKVGAAVARDLIDNGHEVRVLDQRAPEKDIKERAEVVYADIASRYDLLRAVEGCEAIAHLAAIPNPIGTEEILFTPNVLGTQLLLAAAEAHDIKRVVLASTCAMYGLPFAHKPKPPKYLPFDENHPIEPEDLYGLSKHLNELTAATYTRRTGMATTCLRLTHVVDFKNPRMRWMRRMLDNAQDWPSADLWAYIEVRDVGRAFRLAIENVTEGHHAVHIVARDVLAKHDRRDMIRRHFPELEPDLDKFDFESLGFWDTRRAEELFGFKNEIFWKDAIAEWDAEK